MEKSFWHQRILLKLALIAMFSSVSCTKPYAMWQVVMGNYRYEQGRYHEATAHYFNTLQLEYQEAIVYFNLGSLYYALGEAQAAQEMWLNIEQNAPAYLRAQAYYNQGVTYYQLGEYHQAIEQFRNALLLNSQDHNAKINLELTYLALKRQNEREEPKPEGTLPESSQRQLDYLKRRNTLFLGLETQESQWIDLDDL